MTIPVVLFTGFLGAGKTTQINRILQNKAGLRVGAIVNDFGSVNIDEEMLSERADSLIGLKNGCICCSLQGDLLRSLKMISVSKPDVIIIEASGISEPGGIINMILDPVLAASISLEAIVCVIDAEDLMSTPARFDDPVWRSQVHLADFLFVGKTENLDPEISGAIADRLSRITGKPSFKVDSGNIPLEMLVPSQVGMTGNRPSHHDRRSIVARHEDRFASLVWKHDEPVDPDRFQSVMLQLSPNLLRAKGFVEFISLSPQRWLFQLVGARSSLSPAAGNSALKGTHLVLIGYSNSFDSQALIELLDSAIA